MTIDLSIDPVVENLEAREWIQFEMQEGDAVCAHGAVQTCKELKPGDAEIIQAVMRRYGLTEDWNDEEGRTKEEVLRKLRSIEITDTALKSTFGPQWGAIVALIPRAAVLTEGEVKNLHAAWDDARGGDWDATWHTAVRAKWGVGRDAEWDASWLAAWEAARVASGDAARPAAQDAAQDAARALVVRDLISPDGFTQEHYNTLTRPWATVIGKVHPDDVERKP